MRAGRTALPFRADFFAGCADDFLNEQLLASSALNARRPEGPDSDRHVETRVVMLELSDIRKGQVTLWHGEALYGNYWIRSMRNLTVFHGGLVSAV